MDINLFAKILKKKGFFYMKTCLVVDDVTVTRFAARSFLEELGLNVLEAENTDQALNSLQANKTVDVVLLDWHLKKESGLDLLEKIKGQYGNNINVVLFSGVEDSGSASKAKSSGASGFISKPTTKEKIEQEFKNIGVL